MSNIFPPSERLSADQQAQIRDAVFAAIGDDVTATAPARRRRWTVGLATSAAGLTTLVALLLTMSGGTPALASWTAVPQRVPVSQADRLATACEQQVAAGRFPIHLGVPVSVLAESRGSSKAVLLVGSSGNEAICVNPPASGGSSQSAGGSGPVVGIGAPDASHGLLTVDGVPGGPGLGATAVYGRVTVRAGRVLVTTSDGKLVTATLGHGYFLAWWPSGAGIKSIRVLSSTGAVLANVVYSGSQDGSSPIPAHQ